MQLRRLELADFRNFQAAQVHFGERFTVLHGQNGAGKTNVLEALYLLSTLRSFRGADLKAMMRRDQVASQISLEAFDSRLGVPTTLTVRIDRSSRSTRRSARVDEKLIRAASDFYGRLSAVLFTPEDLNILRGSPKGRRQFLDRVLFARAKAHISDVAAYEKVLRSRNRLLKDAYGQRPDFELLESYERGLVDYGARIIERRAQLVRDIAPSFRAAFAQIHDLETEGVHGTGSDEQRANAQLLACTMGYRSTVSEFTTEPAGSKTSNWRAAFEAAIAATRAKDLARGTTSIGPHRDELEVELDGSPAIHFASQGQTRALVLAFKIAELRQTRELVGHAPLLLLDDVTSELDPRRNAQLFEALACEVGQCVLTTTAPEYIRLPTRVARLDLQVRAGEILAQNGA